MFHNTGLIKIIVFQQLRNWRLNNIKFEEVLPALREGIKVRRKDSSWIGYYECIYVNRVGYVIPNRAYFDDYTLNTEDLNADDWEIIREPKKVKLRDLTEKIN